MTPTEIHLVRCHSGRYQEDSHTQVICAVVDKAAAEALVAKFTELVKQAPAIADRMYDHLNAWAKTKSFPGADEGFSEADQMAWHAAHEQERAAWFDAQGITDPDLCQAVTWYSDENEHYSFDVATVPLRTA